MDRFSTTLPGFGAYVLGLILILGVRASEEPVDLAVVHRIKAEAFKSSHVIDHLFQLTYVIGPRLPGSPGFQSAAEWVRQELQGWGLANVHLEPWGPFGRGWTFSRFEIHMIKPQFMPLHGMPLAWSSGTKDPVIAPL